MQILNVPRRPTIDEMEALARDVLERTSEYFESEEELREVRVEVAGAYIAVFDHYLASSKLCPRKVMIVIWNGGSEYYELYAWQPDGSLCRYQQSVDWFEMFTPET